MQYCVAHHETIAPKFNEMADINNSSVSIRATAQSTQFEQVPSILIAKDELDHNTPHRAACFYHLLYTYFTVSPHTKNSLRLCSAHESSPSALTQLVSKVWHTGGGEMANRGKREEGGENLREHITPVLRCLLKASTQAASSCSQWGDFILARGRWRQREVHTTYEVVT